MGPRASDDDKLLAASLKLRDSVSPWKFVNVPASEVMMRFGWQVLSGTEFGTDKGVLSFEDAYDRWTWER